MWKTRYLLFPTRVLLFHPDVKGLWTVCGNGLPGFLFNLPCGKEKLNVENSVQKVDNFPACPAGFGRRRGRGDKFSSFSSRLVEKAGSGLHVFDDVVHRFPQVLVVFHIPLHGLEGVDDGGVIPA